MPITEIVLHVILGMGMPRGYLFLGLFFGLYIPMQTSWFLIPLGFLLAPRTMLLSSLMILGMPMWILLFPITLDISDVYKANVKPDIKDAPKED